MPWRELYWHRNFFFDKVSHLRHPSGHQPFSFSICFWSSNFVFDQDLRNFKLGQNNYNFVAQNYKYSSTGCMVSWLAVSLEMDAPKNLGFGNVSAPRKRLKCCQVVEWTKHKAMIPVNVVITVFAHFFLFFLGFWSLCPPFILPSGVHIECSMCAQPASKEVKWQTINRD